MVEGTCSGAAAVEASALIHPPRFTRYVGIDYSGAKTPTASQPGLRLFAAERLTPADEVPPPPSPRKYWSRREVAEWLVERLREPVPTIVGVDHAFSFPLKYFAKHGLPGDWPAFLDDFQRHWPTDSDHMYVDFVRDGLHGQGAARSGSSRWRRLTEERTRAKSVFHFDVPGSVAKATHAGLPWLRHIRRELGDLVHVWPFDGWALPPGRSAIVEVYPALWKHGVPRAGRNDHQHDAFVVAEWLRRADRDGTLAEYLQPHLGAAELERAGIEGWILGVM